MSQQALSPEVHIIIMPSEVISHLHMPMVMAQVITGMPFIIMQQLIMPPAIILHMLCIMLHCILSSQQQVIFMPPSHFSIFMVQRGMAIMLGMLIPGIIPGIIMPLPIIPISFIRPVIIVVIIGLPSF